MYRKDDPHQLKFHNFYLPFAGELSRENRRYCKEKGIRLSGAPLGRPKKITEANACELKQRRRIHRQDEIDRIAIEGKFGQGKRRFTLDRIMAKLAKTSEAVITISFIVMNLERILSALLYFLLCFCRMCRITLQAYATRERNRYRGVQIVA